jgi:hypothetical protein
MESHVRFLSFRRFKNLQPWLPGAACLIALLVGTAVFGQTTPETSPGAHPTVPAEIQPGHTAAGHAAPDAPREPAPSPQTALPSPQPEGKETGVIRPPAMGDTGIRKPPPSSDSTMPTVPPPGLLEETRISFQNSF